MLSLTIAARFLRRSPVQSILIVAGIAVGIGVQVFLGSLITSLQASLVDQTIGHSPQVMVQSSTAGQPIAYGPALKQTLTSQPGVTTVVPTRTFSAIYRQGQVSAPLELTGGELGQLNTIYDISGRMSAGKAQLGAGDVLVGKDFATRNELSPGSRLTLVLPSGKPADLTVSGIFDFGSTAANLATAFVDGSYGASVLGYTADQYSAIDMQVHNVFASKQVAAQLEAQPAVSGLKVSEWQSQNSDLLSALKSQSYSSYMIQFFVLVAVALGIASTLAISAVQKTRQSGILKAMGMEDRQSGRIFLWQAAILGLGGAAVGVGAGLALIGLFTFLGRNSSALFPIHPQVWFIVLSFGVGVLVAMLSSLIPSRRTTKLDPIEVIQGG